MFLSSIKGALVLFLISICVSDILSEPHESMFADRRVRVNSLFQVKLSNGKQVSLKDIHFVTAIYCPVHEIDGNHSPSAFVSVSQSTGLIPYYYQHLIVVDSCFNAFTVDMIPDEEDFVLSLSSIWVCFVMLSASQY